MEPKLINSEDLFKKQLKWIMDYFNIKEERGELNLFYKAAYKPVKFTYDIIFNNLQVENEEKFVMYYYPLKDCFLEADIFFKSEIGLLYIEIMTYFNQHYYTK